MLPYMARETYMEEGGPSSSKASLHVASKLLGLAHRTVAGTAQWLDSRRKEMGG